MKKYAYIVLALILVAAVMSGCRNRNDGTDTSVPAIVPTAEMPTNAPTQATTEATTAPTTEPRETYDNGNGPLPTDDMGTTDATGNGSAAGGTDTTEGGMDPVTRGRARGPRNR